MFFQIPIGGRSCSFDEVLSVSGAGAFTYDYKYPYLYIVDEGVSGDGILLIYNVANAAGPTLLSTTALPADTSPREPRIYDNHLYIPYKQSQDLAIWDVTDRANPVLLSTTDLSAELDAFQGPTSVAKIGDVAVVLYGFGFTMDHTMQKIDVSDPSNPVLGATLNPYHPAIVSSGMDVFALNGDFVVAGVVTGGSSVPYIATIDPASFTVRDIVTMGLAGSSCSLISTDGVGHVYLYDGNDDVLFAVDVSDPDNIVVAGSETPIASAGSGARHPTIVIPELDRLYVGRAGGGGLAIYIIDISDRDNPSNIGTKSTAGETCTCMRRIDGCAGFAWAQGTGAAIHLMGEAPTS